MMEIRKDKQLEIKDAHHARELTEEMLIILQAEDLARIMATISQTIKRGENKVYCNRMYSQLKKKLKDKGFKVVSNSLLWFIPTYNSKHIISW